MVFLYHQLHCRSHNSPYKGFSPVGQLAGVEATQDETGSSRASWGQRANQQPGCDILRLSDQLIEGPGVFREQATRCETWRMQTEG